MGYETRYKLEFSGDLTYKEDANGNPSSIFINRTIDTINLLEEVRIISGYRYLFGDHVKWYEHEDHMRTISIRYPNLVFELRGEGEEADDLWIKYFKNGKMQHCEAKITYDKFDPKKLS